MSASQVLAGVRGSLPARGVVILTGPSSCGKGEVANALCWLMGVDRSRHLSMGDILRSAVERARGDDGWREDLARRHQISAQNEIDSCIDSSEELRDKVARHRSELAIFFERAGSDVPISQLDWLAFCTARGLLVPNRWTQVLISAEIEHVHACADAPFILDGYPRTVPAAKHLVGSLTTLGVPVIRVLHLSITREEMMLRARRRGRADDDEAALASRFEFYLENVKPSVAYLERALGSGQVSLIDAHQPTYHSRRPGADAAIDLPRSIGNVVSLALQSLGVTHSQAEAGALAWLGRGAEASA